MQAYTDVVPPSAVTHAIHAPFTSADSNNLIVARTCLLQIFEVRGVKSEVGEPKHGRKVLSLRARAGEHYPGPDPRALFLIAEYHLSGTIADLKSVEVVSSKSGGHALIVAIKSAKASLIQWDPDTFSIVTTSIHLYEENITVNAVAPDLSECPTQLTVDPSNRCVGLYYGSRNIAVIPFRTSGDELVAEDDDDHVNGEAVPSAAAQESSNANTASERPYFRSFALPLSTLNQDLNSITDLAFLHEYREPTLGVISSYRDPAPGLSQRLRDIKVYSVFSLDLEQKARTMLISVPNLPNDIFQLKPLPSPVGGVLLIGGNEIIHVDQAGRTTASAVNEFAKAESGFTMTDQSALQLKLEGCTVEQLRGTNGDLLFCLSNGQFVILSFRRDGRSISGFSISVVPQEKGGRIVLTSAVCAASVDSTTLFVAGDNSDALLLGCISKGPQLSRKRSHAEMLGVDEDALSEGDLDDEDEDDDDIYDISGTTRDQRKGTSTQRATDIAFSIMDLLPNFAAHGQTTFAPAFKGPVPDDTADGCLVVPVGKRNAGGFTVFSNELVPKSTQYLENITDAKQAWFIEGMGKDLILTSVDTASETTSAKIYEMVDGNPVLVESRDLDTENETIDVYTLDRGKRFIQVTRSGLTIFDMAVNLQQIVPIEDDNTGEDLQIVHTSFADPFLLVIRSDHSALLFKPTANNEYEEPEKIDVLAEKIWTTGCLYCEPEAENPLLFLVDKSSGLLILDLNSPDNPIAKFEGLVVTPPVLTSDPLRGRLVAREEVLEIVVAELGDESVKQSYLTVRTAANDVVLYQPFHTSGVRKNFVEGLRWLKVGCIPLDDDIALDSSLPEFPTKLVTYDGKLLISGSSSYVVSKTAATLPTSVRYAAGHLQCLRGASTHGISNRVLAVNSYYETTLSELPDDRLTVGEGWLARPISLKQEVLCICYHDLSHNFVIGVGQIEPFDLPEDNYHQNYATEDVDLKPVQTEGSIKLMSAATNAIIDEFPLGSDEVSLCIKSCSLAVSEDDLERKELIVAGTSISRGEDLPCNGNIYVFEIIDVVPEEGSPETRWKLKLLHQVEVRGAVTAIAELTRKGLVAIAQGQKCMVRGLKEDNSFLPTAFHDTPVYISSLKTMRGNEMILMADVTKGVYYSGYSEQPYKVQPFGRSRTSLRVIAADFLPYGKRLFATIAGPDSKMQVLEYDPDHPESLQGQRLLQKNTFQTGHLAASMVSVLASDRSSEFDEDGDADMNSDSPASCKVIITTQTGAIGLVTCIDEETYRQLGAVQAHLQTSIDHPCGLNPRAYREVESDGWGSRGILDGNILRLWHTLSAQRRLEASTRAGVESWKIKADLLGLKNPILFDYRAEYET